MTGEYPAAGAAGRESLAGAESTSCHDGPVNPRYTQLRSRDVVPGVMPTSSDFGAPQQSFE